MIDLADELTHSNIVHLQLLDEKTVKKLSKILELDDLDFDMIMLMSKRKEENIKKIDLIKQGIIPESLSHTENDTHQQVRHQMTQLETSDSKTIGEGFKPKIWTGKEILTNIIDADWDEHDKLITYEDYKKIENQQFISLEDLEKAINECEKKYQANYSKLKQSLGIARKE